MAGFYGSKTVCHGPWGTKRLVRKLLVQAGDSGTLAVVEHPVPLLVGELVLGRLRELEDSAASEQELALEEADDISAVGGSRSDLEHLAVARGHVRHYRHAPFDAPFDLELVAGRLSLTGAEKLKLKTVYHTADEIDGLVLFISQRLARQFLLGNGSKLTEEFLNLGALRSSRLPLPANHMPAAPLATGS